MGNVISMKRQPPLYWTIDIEPDHPDYLDIRKHDDYINIFLAVEDFDRIDEMRKRALALLREY